MHLTAILKLRANDHDQRLLRIALSRWSAGLSEGLDRARSRQRALLRCIAMWRSADGSRERLVLEKKRLHSIVLECVQGITTHLHSTARMSLIAALEEQLGSWLGQYVEWLNHGRSTPKPQFPTLPPPTARAAEERYVMALQASRDVTTLLDEKRWRAEVQRTARGRLSPQYFGAATSGEKPGAMAHCGLLRRDDGRYYALLTLWPLGDPLGEPVRRAHNRAHAGTVRNVRAEASFAPTERARVSIMVPLEMGHGHEHLFFGRATPKSAELVRRSDDYYVHVAFEFPEHPPRPGSGNILAVRRGITTLLAVVVVDPRGRRLDCKRIDGRDLARLITEIRRVRALKQQKGHLLAGDRRASRTTEHHLYSAGHQIIDLACRYGAEIVLLQDPGARKSLRFLAYRHLHRLADILTQLSAEAGLPTPQERKIYGSWSICARCGWTPGDAVRQEQVDAGQCPGCATQRDPEYHLAHLLALDTLRYRLPENQRPRLGEFIRSLTVSE